MEIYMQKRIVAGLLSATMLIQGLAVVSAAAKPVIYVNECFDEYAFNEEVNEGTVYAVKGVDARVVERKGLDKALYAKAWGKSAMLRADVTPDSSTIIMSADIMLDENTADGEMFKLTDKSGKSTTLIKLGKNNRIMTGDGGNIGLYQAGQWMHLDLEINLKKAQYSVYINGRSAEENWYFTNKSIKSVASVTFEAFPNEDNSPSGLCLDNFRVYSGSDILDDSNFCSDNASMKKLDYQLTEQMPTAGDSILLNVSFNNSYAYVPQTKNNVIALRKEDNNSYLYMSSKNDPSDSCYIDVNLTSEDQELLANTKSYVLEFDYKPDEISGTVDLFYPKSDEGWRSNEAIRMNASGALTCMGESMGNLTFGEWNHIAFIFDNFKNQFTCYINGVRSKNTAYMSFKPTLFRCGAAYSGVEIDMAVDNLKLYEGETLREIANSGEDGSDDSILSGFKSVMETEADALSKLGKTDFAMMPSNGAYIAKGEPKKYSEQKPYIKNGRTMLPVRLVSESLGCSVDWDEAAKTVTVNDNVKMTVGDNTLTVGKEVYKMDAVAEIVNDSVYLPLRDLCERALGRYVYWDNRGFLVVSSTEFKLSDSQQVEELYDPIDTLYRYLQFERPSGSKIAADIIKNCPDNAHPRILGTAATLERFKENVKRDEEMAEMAQTLIKTADAYCAAEPIYYGLTDETPARLIYKARDIRQRSLCYATAYILTGDKKYVQGAWKDISVVCTDYPDWNDYRVFLDAAEMCFGVAVAYDTFYNEFTDEQKQIIRNAVKRNAFERVLIAYEGKHPNGYWVNGDDNFTSVCPGGVMSAAVAMVDDEDTTEICKTVLEQTLQSFEYVISLFYPDGAWYEGVGYAAYTMRYMYAGLGALINAAGTDYSMLEAPGMNNVVNYGIAMHGFARGAFNYHDGSENFQLDGCWIWLANLLGQGEYITPYMKFKDKLDPGFVDAILLLNYDPDAAASGKEMDLDYFFRGAESGIIRQNWEIGGNWAGVHAGPNGVDHDHLDLGEFIFESNGIRWVNDLGSDNYNIPGYFALPGYSVYRKRPEANNCLVINPRTDHYQQNLKCNTQLVRSESKPCGAMMVFDLSNAYTEDAKAYTRGFMLGDDRRSFLIRDEVELLRESELYWFMNTPADISTDGKSAMLSYKGEKLRVEVNTDADSYEVTTMPMKPLDTSPTVNGMADDSAKTKLVIKLKASGKVNISVKLIPEIGYTGDISAPDNTPISDWYIPDGDIPAKPSASAITLNGNAVSSFSNKTYAYSVPWYNDEPLPTVDAAADGYIKEITQTDSWDKAAVIRLTDPNNPDSITEYTVKFNRVLRVVPMEGYKYLDISSVYASSEPAKETPATAVIDSDADTRWSAEGDGEWVELDLGEVKHFDAIEMAFYLGDKRTTRFDLAVSNDGVNYETIFTGDTSGNTAGCETYVAAADARYVRFIGHGNSEGSMWVSVNEFRPLIKQ